MNTLEILKSARKLIERPENWTKGELARFNDYTPTHSHHKDACKFCMVGAVQNASYPNPAGDVLNHLMVNLGMRIADFNDHPRTTHADVLSAFDKAIALLEGK